MHVITSAATAVLSVLGPIRILFIVGVTGRTHNPQGFVVAMSREHIRDIILLRSQDKMFRVAASRIVALVPDN